jgi:hypothetical protein
MTRQRWVYPTLKPHVTSGFSLSRLHPVYMIPMPHTGVDYRAASGVPIVAAADGVVSRSVYDDRAGIYVRIDHGDGVWTGYSHLSERHVLAGHAVTAGQQIGEAGATGSATAAHLHFEVSVDGVKVDPVPWLAERTAVVVSRPLAYGEPLPELDPLNPPAPLEPVDPKDDDMVRTIEWCYSALQGRQPAAPEVEAWLGVSDGKTAHELYAIFLESPAERGAVIRAFADFLGRQPSEADIASHIAAGRTIAGVRRNVRGSAEAKARGW